MSRKLVILIIIYGVIITVYAVLRPRPVDWSETLDRDDKIPFGTYVMYQQLEDVLIPQNISSSGEPFYRTLLGGNIDVDIVVTICPNFQPDDLDISELLSFVEQGNIAFISSMTFDGVIRERLGFDISYEWIDTFDWQRLHFSEQRQMTLDSMPGDEWMVPVMAARTYFSLPDSLTGDSIHVLGGTSGSRPNYLLYRRGSGLLYLHCAPLVFSNYFLLDTSFEMQSYASAVMSHLPAGRRVQWNDYYITGGQRSGNPLQVLGRYRGFRWAYWIALITSVLFLFFTAKRRQSPIPIVKPLRNNSLDYVRTMGDLYYRRGSHIDLANKKIAYFREYLNEHFGISPVDFSDQEVEKAALKTGKPREIVEILFRNIRSVLRKERLQDQELIELQNSFNEFYEISK